MCCVCILSFHESIASCGKMITGKLMLYLGASSLSVPVGRLLCAKALNETNVKTIANTVVFIVLNFKWLKISLVFASGFVLKKNCFNRITNAMIVRNGSSIVLK